MGLQDITSSLANCRGEQWGKSGSTWVALMDASTDASTDANWMPQRMLVECRLDVDGDASTDAGSKK